MKLAPVRVFSCKHPLSYVFHLRNQGRSQPIDSVGPGLQILGWITLPLVKNYTLLG